MSTQSRKHSAAESGVNTAAGEEVQAVDGTCDVIIGVNPPYFSAKCGFQFHDPGVAPIDHSDNVGLQQGALHDVTSGLSYEFTVTRVRN